MNEERITLKRLPYQNYYAGDDGQIYSCKRYKTPTMLKPHMDNKKEYFKTTISVKGNLISFQTHRLICQAFHSNPNNLPEVHHKDKNKSNNKPYNLEWISVKDNRYQKGKLPKHLIKRYYHTDIVLPSTSHLTV